MSFEATRPACRRSSTSWSTTSWSSIVPSSLFEEGVSRLRDASGRPVARVRRHVKLLVEKTDGNLRAAASGRLSDEAGLRPMDASRAPTSHARRATSRPSAARVDDALRGFCDGYLGSLEPVVAEAIRYSLLARGSGWRPVLVLAAYEAAGGAGDAAVLAAAVEVVHAYSLVHDDLPCMDDDDVRRGRPTVHRVYGVPAATAAGLAMVPMAARCALDAAPRLGLPDATCGAIVGELMRASGAGGMIGGQQLDLEGEGESLTLAQLERIHRAKTGALILAAAVLGGLAAGAGEARLEALRRYGSAVGLAFQIATTS
jgi:hypothetical protein